MERPSDCKYTLSIVVPVYNVERYIKNCLDSILASDLPKDDYEVILVNDGSTDVSGVIAQEYTEKYDTWRYVEQENQGLSVARNTGIREAKGEFVWCVDSDDLIYHQLMPIYNLLKKEPVLDLVECKLKVFQDKSEHTLTQLDGHVLYASGSEFIRNGYEPGSACKKIIRRQFITENDLWFVPGLIHQDTEQSYRLYAYAKMVCQCDYYIYHYRWGNESLTRTKNPKKILNGITSNIYISKSFEKLADTFDTTDHDMAEVIREKAMSLRLTTVLSLLTKKKEYKRLGIHSQILDELKKQGSYPLKGDFYSFKKNVVKRILNMEILLR